MEVSRGHQVQGGRDEGDSNLGKYQEAEEEKDFWHQ